MRLRHSLAVVLAALLLPLSAALAADGVVHRTESCGCCHLWTEVMKDYDLEFEDDVVEQDELMALKREFGLPVNASACHTAEIDGYLVEGHVPAFAIERLLAERPEGVRGVVVPGMPPQSPGMGGPLVDYDIYLLTDDGDLEPWLRARGSVEIPAD